MKYLILILLSLSLSILNSQPKWVKLNDIDDTGRLGKFEVNNQFVTILSLTNYINPTLKNPGFIYFSKDTGNSWTKIYLADTAIDYSDIEFLPFKENLYSMAYPDTNFCLVIGDNGLYFQSNDNLKTWKKSTNKIYDLVNQIYFNNSFYGVMVVKNENNWFLYKTINGGNNWYPINNTSNDTILRNMNYVPIKDLVFIDTNVIFTIQFLKNYKPPYRYLLSKDLGVTWEFWEDENPGIWGPTIISSTKSIGIKNKLIDEDTGEYIVEIFRSNYFGKNYKKIYEIKDELKNGFHSWYFCDSLNGIAATINRVYRTTNGGESWFRDEYLKSEDFTETFREVKLINPNVALLFGQKNLYRIDYKQTGNVIEYETNETQNLTLNNNIFELNKYIDCTENQYNYYKIYNYTGELIESNNLNNCKIELSNLPNGIYLIEISNLSKILKLKVNLFRN